MIRAANPYILVQAIERQNYSMARKLAENGINANERASEIIHMLASRNDRDFFKTLTDLGMEINSNNYSAMQACIKTDNLDGAKLLINKSMDFDLYTEWIKNDNYAVKDGETHSAVKEYWEFEFNQDNEQKIGGIQNG